MDQGRCLWWNFCRYHRNSKILKNFIGGCKNYNISVVAEGVENEKEYDILKEMGCDEAQGYLFDKPMSWNRFEEKYL